MKLTCTAFALGLLSQSAAAALASVYLFDPLSSPRPQATLDPISARLVLAQRAGVEDFHDSDLGKREVVDAINQYGVRTALFAAEETRRQRAFVLLAGELDDIEAESLRAHSNFEISPAPSVVDSKSLYIDLVKQSDPSAFLMLTDEGAYAKISKEETFALNGDMYYIATSMRGFEAVFTRLVEKNTWSITGLITSSQTTSKSGEASGNWGTYEMPGQRASPKKRQAAKEKPLTETRPDRPLSAQTSPAHVFANTTRPLSGILPACFHSQSQCVEQTNNCTGHGQCKLKYHDKTAAGNQDCYSCQCSSTRSDDGKFTTIWAGPACQKKDISVQFWLIVLFTVGLIFLIGFAIGQVWEMGEQELPSVIGAGVSGPSARK